MTKKSNFDKNAESVQIEDINSITPKRRLLVGAAVQTVLSSSDDKKTSEIENTSVVKRRSFLKKSASGAVLVSLPAQSVWGACSVSGAMSGNLSQNQAAMIVRCLRCRREKFGLGGKTCTKTSITTTQSTALQV